MQNKCLSILAATLLATGFAWASEADEKRVSNIAIAEVDSSGGDPVFVELSGDDLGFSLNDMQVGESRSVVDAAGQNVLITRTEEGYDFAVDGRNISMPELDEHLGHVEMIDIADGDFDVEILSSNRTLLDAGPPGIAVITTTPLDATTQASIQSVLHSAGHYEQVTFIDRQSARETHDGVETAHRIRVFRNEVQVTE